MPQYEYHCQNCDHDFTVEMSISEHERKETNRDIHCPKCQSLHVRHVIQSVNIVTSKKS